MSNHYRTIAEKISTLQRNIVKYFGIADRNFSIKVVQGGYIAFTELMQEKASTIYISEDNLLIDHILGHEITHTQLPVKNKFFAEGFASLISCKIAGNCFIINLKLINFIFSYLNNMMCMTRYPDFRLNIKSLG